ncbi:MAG TPA: twin-arginine translocation signal domain-containing protein, partial [Bacteroidota bacterium]|nr:twin-arginine translocation signal domain-containing protein [Bacteroidota bacterium]
MSITRRRFIKAASTIALAGVAKSLPVFSEQQNTVSGNSRIAVFFEPDFPAVDTVHVDQTLLNEALKDLHPTFITSHDLPAQLHDFDILIMPYGSAFPKNAWGVFLEFFRNGGNFVNLGGVPFSVPVDHDVNGWRVEVRQTEYHKILGITQAFPVSSDFITSYIANDELPNSEILLKKFTVEECFELYVRFTNTKDYPNEDGSGGQRDAVLKPLLFGLDEKKIKRVAPIIQIDHIQGDYAGGRWILANFTGTITGSAIRELVSCAMQGSIELTARTSFACYHEGEVPSITIQLRRHVGDVERFIDEDCSIEIHN